MSLFCDSGYEGDDVAWWWYKPKDEAPLATKRSRKCCSCGERIAVGSVARKIRRFRSPTEFEETRGLYGDEVPMPDWYLCETCGDIADSLAEVGFCYTLGDESLKEQIEEYRREEAQRREYTMTHNDKHNRPASAGPG